MKVFQLFGEISVDKRSAMRSISDVEGHAGRSSNRIGKIFGKLGRAMGTAIKVGAIAAGAAIVGIGVAAIKAAADYEQAMAMVRAVTGATAEEFAALDVKAKELGLTSKFTMTEIAAGMEFLGRAGFEATAIIDAMSGVSALAAAQMMDLASAADIVSNVLTGMGLAASDAERVANVFAATTASANVNVQELGESFKYFAPLAKQFRIPLETAAAMIGKLGDAGIKGTMATRTLTTAFTRLADPTEEMITTMEDLGITFFDQEGAFIGVEDMIGKLEVSLGGLTDQQRAVAMSTLFGIEATKQMNILLDVGEEDFRDYTAAITDTTAAFEQQAIQNATMQGQLTILKGSWTLLLTTLGTAVLPVLTTLMKRHIIPWVNTITAWIEKMGGLSGIFDIVKDRIVEFVGGSENMDAILNTVKTSLGWLWDKFKDFAAWLGSVFSNTIQVMASMIQGDWYGVMDRLKDIITETWDALPIPEGVRESILAFFTDLAPTAATIWANIKQGAIDAWEGIKASIEENGARILTAWDSLRTAVGNLWTAFSNAFSSIRGAFGLTGDSATSFKNIVKAIFDTGLVVVETWLNLMTSQFNLIASLLRGDWQAAWTEFKNFYLIIWDAISKVIDILGIGDAIAAGWETIKNLAGGWYTDAVGWGQSVIDSFKAGLQEKWSDITTWFSNAWTTLVNTLTTWMPGWLRSMLGIEEAMDQLDAELSTELGWGPPSTVTNAAEGYGEDVARAIGQGAGQYDLAPTGLALVGSLGIGLSSPFAVSGLEDIGLEMIPPLVSGLAGYNYDDAGFTIAQGLGSGVGSYFAGITLVDAGTEAAVKIGEGVDQYDMDPTGQNAVTSIGEGITAHALEIMDRGAVIAWMIEFGLRGEDPALAAAGADTAVMIDSGIATQLEGGISWRLGYAVEDYIDGLIAAMQDALQAYSPSRRAMKLGGDFVKGLAMGIQSGTRNIKDMLDNVMPASTIAFSASMGSIIGPSMSEPALAVAGGGDIYVNIESVTIREEADVRKVAVQIMDLTEDERRAQGRDSLVGG